MASNSDVAAKCEQIRKDYSPCDVKSHIENNIYNGRGLTIYQVSDALLKLHVPNAGLLTDISPIPSRWNASNPQRLVAPISTVLFVANDHQPGAEVPGLKVPNESNMTKDKHFSDVAAPGTVVLMQQPQDQVAALVGDIVATRYKYRGVLGCVVDGRTRDVVGCGDICKDGKFQTWSKSLSSVGTSLEGKPWATDVPLKIGKVEIKPGDILCADEGEMVCNVIPREKLDEVVKLLPVLKEADDGLLKDVQNGMGFKAAIVRHPNHYTNH